MKTHYDLNELEPQERDSLMFTLGTLFGDRHEMLQWIADMMSYEPPRPQCRGCTVLSAEMIASTRLP